MFGMGITEILLIAIVAVIALGPEKLPDAMVKIAKMFNSVKKGISDAKTTLDNELNIAELKEEANKFKAQIEDTKSSLSIENKFDLGIDDILKDDLKPENEVEKIKEKYGKIPSTKVLNTAIENLDRSIVTEMLRKKGLEEKQKFQEAAPKELTPEQEVVETSKNNIAENIDAVTKKDIHKMKLYPYSTLKNYHQELNIEDSTNNTP